MACKFSIFAALLFLLVDLFLAKDYVSVPIEILGAVIFYMFYRFNKKFKNKRRLYFWFILTLIVIVNLGWYTGGGFNIANTSIFYLTGIVSVIILNNPYKNRVLVFLLFDFAVLSAMEYLFPEIKVYLNSSPIQNVSSDIFILITIFVGAGLLSYFKRRYEEEREIIKVQVELLDHKNDEITAQNEELLRQHEEITTQRSYIEINNQKL